MSAKKNPNHCEQRFGVFLNRGRSRATISVKNWILALGRQRCNNFPPAAGLEGFYPKTT
jgi:hypothetical protein